MSKDCIVKHKEGRYFETTSANGVTCTFFMNDENAETTYTIKTRYPFVADEVRDFYEDLSIEYIKKIRQAQVDQNSQEVKE